MSAANEIRWIVHLRKFRHPLQRRDLHLYKLANSRTPLGQHKILPFSQYQVPAPETSTQAVNVWDKPEGELVAAGVALPELLKNYVRPGRFLCATAGIEKTLAENVQALKENDISRTYNNYYLADFSSEAPRQMSSKKAKSSNQLVKHLAKLSEVHVSLASPISHWARTMNIAYHHVAFGNPVEFSIRLRGKHVPPNERMLSGDATLWPWMHDSFPHLRPDFILKALPGDAYFIIDPFSDGNHVQFVVWKRPAGMKEGLAATSLTKRVLKMKMAVSESIKLGKQSQLPKSHGQALTDAGIFEYTTNDGYPGGQQGPRSAGDGSSATNKGGSNEGN